VQPTPLFPHSQEGTQGGVKKLYKLVLMKLVLVKTGNGEKKFLQSNTISGVSINSFIEKYAML
jgi:hypothetical protein